MTSPSTILYTGFLSGTKWSALHDLIFYYLICFLQIIQYVRQGRILGIFINTICVWLFVCESACKKVGFCLHFTNGFWYVIWHHHSVVTYRRKLPMNILCMLPTGNWYAETLLTKWWFILACTVVSVEKVLQLCTDISKLLSKSIDSKQALD